MSKPQSPVVPALRRLGFVAPPPFVGRESELAALAEALTGSVLLIVSGGVGAGKTRLVRELCEREAAQPLSPVIVRTRPGDRGEAIRARAERELGALPGTLDNVLREQPRLLVIDDAHHLVDGPDTLRGLATDAGAGRVLLITSERLPLRRAQSQRFEMVVEGLDEASARELWTHLEERFGPTRAGACDQALVVTGGVPMALRREFARALAGDDRGSAIEGLSDDARRMAEAIAVIDLPVAPPALAAMLENVDIEKALIELVTAQVLDPLTDGRFAMHCEIAHEVLAELGDRRLALESVAAVHIDGASHGGGAFGLLDRVDRLRECARHHLAAEQPEKAAEIVVAGFDDAASRGCAGEVTALARRIESASPALVPLMRTIRARAARRQGKVVAALELGGVGDAVTDAWLRYQAGTVAAARKELARLASSTALDEAALAISRLVRVEISAGDLDAARDRLAALFDAGISGLSDEARAHLHLAMSSVASADGDSTSARASLARARGAGDVGAEMIAVIDLHRVELLATEGRTGEAQELLSRVSEAVAQLDLGVLADEVRRQRAQLAVRRGDLARASDEQRALVARHREAGAEVPAARVELDLAETMLRRGELKAAAELARAAANAASSRGLKLFEIRATLVTAAVDLLVLRTDSAAPAIDRAATSSSAALRRRASKLERLLRAWQGEPLPTAAGESDVIAESAHGIAIAVAQRDMVGALQLAREQAAAAEGAGRDAEMVEALAILSRLQLARGDRAGATAAASRAARASLRCGMTLARSDALLVLSALSRDNSELTSAQAYAQDALSLATSAGLPLQRLAASRAMEVIAVGDSGGVAQVAEREAAAAAAMTDLAVEATAQLLADLGLTSARPFRVVSSTGVESFVADANPNVLRMEERGLVVDAVREVIVRAGKEVADLRRRSLLKRLLFLFARSPGVVFSKEDIVQTVWEVEYHPLRHDAALFTNIMRIRRLLGSDGADLIRVSDEGYRFCPEKDFLYVENVTPE